MRCVLFEEEERAGDNEEDPRPATVDAVAMVVAIFFFSPLLFSVGLRLRLEVQVKGAETWGWFCHVMCDGESMEEGKNEILEMDIDQ